MTNHTPGRWKQGFTLVTPQTLQWSAEQIAANDARERRMVFANFSVLDNGRSRRRVAVCEREADARLIAALPELLSALKAMLTHMGMDEDEWNKPTFDQARAAIAKAEGQE